MKTKTPLQLSREHWQRLATGTAKKGEYIGPSHCALCLHYWELNSKYAKYDKCSCAGCPVATKTGQPYCRGTPYDVIDNFIDNMVQEATETTEQYQAKVKADPEFQRLAKLELDFLNSLEEPTTPTITNENTKTTTQSEN